MKRIIYLLLTALMFIGMLSACQKTPESPIVIGKNLDKLLEKAQGTEDVSEKTRNRGLKPLSMKPICS